jgi:Rrf2 family protein
MRNSSSFEDRPVLSKTADYALRALLVLGRRGTGRPLPAETIAELTGTPANYLSKTLYALARDGLLRSSRGPAGGFALAVPADAITIAQIADVFAEPVPQRQCLLGTGPCNAAAPCAAHHHWKRVAIAAREPLITTTIADLLVGADAIAANDTIDTESRIHATSGAAGF